MDTSLRMRRDSERPVARATFSLQRPGQARRMAVQSTKSPLSLLHILI